MTAAEVAEAMLGFAGRDSPDQAIHGPARREFSDTARMVYQAVSQRTATTVAIADAVKSGLAQRPQLLDGIAYTSNSMVGYFATTGELLSLPGHLPDFAVLQRIPMDIKEVGQKVAKALIARSPDQETAYVRLRTAAQQKLDARQHRPVTTGTDTDLLERAASLVAQALAEPRTATGQAIAHELIKALVSAYAVPTPRSALTASTPAVR